MPKFGIASSRTNLILALLGKCPSRDFEVLVDDFGERFFEGIPGVKKRDQFARGGVFPITVKGKRATQHSFSRRVRPNSAAETVFLSSERPQYAVDPDIYGIAQHPVGIKRGSLRQNVIYCVQAMAKQDSHNSTAYLVRPSIKLATRSAVDPANCGMVADKVEARTFIQANVALEHEFGRKLVVPIPLAVALPERTFTGSRIVFPDVLRRGQIPISQENPIRVRSVARHSLDPIAVAFPDLFVPRKRKLHISVN